MHRAALRTLVMASAASLLLATASHAQIVFPQPEPEPEVVDPEVAAAELAETVETLPEVEESVGFSYFLIQGSTLEGLDEAMRAKGPGALAGANIWNVSFAEEPCAVSMDATISLPKLIGKAKLTEADLIVWDEMLIALEAYHRQHVAIAQKAATAVRGLNCVSGAEGGIEAEITKFREESIALDESTSNGATVGVTLLPDS